MKKIVKRLLLIGVMVVAAGLGEELRAQHTLGIYGGYGMGNSRFYPRQETRGVWGLYTGGLSWRHYGTQRFAGGFGIDLEWLESAYSVNTNPWEEKKEDLVWYTRRINTLSLPIVWQPHFYIKQRARVFLEAAATFSYRFKSDYEYTSRAEDYHYKGRFDYPYKTARDNRFGYGLAFGGGFAVLIKQFELQVKGRYYFGLADILRNRNKYAGNTTDGDENPFSAQPLRSPLDNIMITVGISYRFNKEGFDVWFIKREKLQKSGIEFGYKTEGGASGKNSRGRTRR